MGAARALLAVTVLTADVAFAAIGWLAGADRAAFAVVLRWSPLVGVALMFTVLLAALGRRVAVLTAAAWLAALRVVVVAVAVFLIGPGRDRIGVEIGRADPSFLGVAVIGVLDALAALVVVLVVRAALRPRR